MKGMNVKLFRTVHVAAHITRCRGISGHADVNGLINWAKAFEEKPQKVFVTHGEDTTVAIFAKRCRMTWVTALVAPFSGTVYDLANNVCIYEAKGVKIRRHLHRRKQQRQREHSKLQRPVYRLLAVIKKNEGTPNIKIWNATQEMYGPCVINEDRPDM